LWGYYFFAGPLYVGEHPTCAIFIQSADFAGAKRLQNQRTLSIFASGAGIAHATRKNGMLPFNSL
jgi:hypothetical protein